MRLGLFYYLYGMKLSEVTTDKTRYDVHRRDLITIVKEDIPQFQEYSGKLPAKKLIQYIILMYDPESPMRREVGNYMQRKGACSDLVGFTKDKQKRPKNVDDMLIGTDKEVNKLIAAYLGHLAMPEYTQLIVLLEIQRTKALEAFSSDVSDNTHKIMEAVTTSISKITKDLFGSGEYDEIKMARQALYEQANLDKPPRPEDVVDTITEDGKLPEDFSPYPDYEVEEPHFLDDEQPKG